MSDTSWDCPTCGKTIQNGALAEYAHIRWHIRRGNFIETVEYWNYGTEQIKVIEIKEEKVNNELSIHS